MMFFFSFFENDLLYRITLIFETLVTSTIKQSISIIRYLNASMGSGALSDKMLFVRIVENNKIDAYFKAD